LIPDEIRRRLTPDELRMYDSLGMHCGGDHERDCGNDGEEQEVEPTIEESLPPAGQVRLVTRKLTQKQFRSLLVDHFDILFQKNQIQWPCRVRAMQPTMPGQNGQP